MPSTKTLTEPSGWRIVGAHAIAITAGVLAALLLRLTLGAPPAPLSFLVTGAVTIGVGLWLMNLFYNRPFRAYRTEKQRLYDEEQEQLRIKRRMAEARTNEERAEIEAHELLFGRALQIKKPRSK